MYGIPLRAILAGVALLAAFVAGIKVSDWRFEARRTAELEAQIAAVKVETERVDRVATAYEGVRTELAAIERGKRVEVYRETQKVEYRCELPAAGERLRIDAINAVNAAAGLVAPAVPGDPNPPGKEPGRAADGLFGADGDLR